MLPNLISGNSCQFLYYFLISAPHLFLWFEPQSVPAQTIEPAVDGTHTQVTVEGDRIEIRGGQLSRDGTNLFHSFEEFGLSEGEVANFLSNPNIENILGRVVGGNPSYINGMLQVWGGNSNLFLINPAGIVFGDAASLNVPGDFTATTATGIGFGDRELNSFGENSWGDLVGSPDGLNFAASNPGSIVNTGNLAVSTGSNLGLFAGTVVNTGTLEAPGGNITLTAVPGESLVRLSAEGNVLALDVAAADSTSVPFIPLSLPKLLTGGEAIAHASDITVNSDGTIGLRGANAQLHPQMGDAIVSGELGNGEWGIGNAEMPTIQVLGERVTLQDATLDASGVGGGGNIFLGGDRQGLGTLPNASETFIDRHSTIAADALFDGNGGEIIVFAEETATIFGTLSARGGELGGNGGFIETSGRQNLVLDTIPDASAANGLGGTWLIDPTDITIVPIGLTVGNNIVAANAISLALSGGSNVILDTSTATGPAGAGDITLSPGAFIRKIAGGEATLTLDADNDITLNDSITSISGELNIVLDADGSIDTGDAVIDSNGGDITLTANASGVGNGELIVGNEIFTHGGSLQLSSLGNEGSLDVTAGKLFSTGNTINLAAGGDLAVGPIDSEGGDVTLTANSDATGEGELEISGDILANGGRIELNSFGDDGSIDTTGASLTTIANTITLSTGGNIEVGPIDSEGGDIILTANSDGIGEGELDISGDILANGGSIQLSSFGDEGGIETTDGTLTTLGNKITLITGGDIEVGAIDSGGGDITLIANSDNLDSGELELEGNITAGGGNIFLTGVGEDGGNDGYGIRVPIGVEVSTTGPGTITLEGTGGGGIDNNHGIRLEGKITAEDGAIELTGTGRGSGDGNRGIEVRLDGVVETTGTGTITLNGRGGDSNRLNHGMRILGNLRSVDGAIDITGVGGNGTGNANRGIVINDNGQVAASGTGSITLNGTGSNDSGIILQNGSVVRSVDGEIQLAGESNQGVGIFLQSGSFLESTGTGNISLTGLAPNGNPGIRLDDSRIDALGGGNIALVAEQIELFGTTAFAGNGTLSLQGESGVEVRLLGARNDLSADGLNILFNGDLILDRDYEINTGLGGGDILFNGSVYGRDLTLNAGTGNIAIADLLVADNFIANSTGTTQFGSSVSAVNLTTDAGGVTVLPNVTTNGSQIYGDAVLLNNPIFLSAGGDILFNDAVNGSPISGLTITGGNSIGGLGNIQVGNGGLNLNASNTINLMGDIAAAADIAISTPGDLTLGNLSTSGFDITLTSKNGAIATGNLSSTNPGMDGGDIFVDAETAIQAGTIDSSSDIGSGGNVTLDPIGDIEVMSIDTQGAIYGGDVFVQAGQHFRSTGTFIDRNGQTASISTAGGADGGTIVIQHGGDGTIPFIVGDATTNGTAGAITRGTDAESTIISGEFPFTHSQDAGQIQAISVPATNPVTPVIEIPATPDTPLEAESVETVSENPIAPEVEPVALSVPQVLPENPDVSEVTPPNGSADAPLLDLPLVPPISEIAPEETSIPNGEQLAEIPSSPETSIVDGESPISGESPILESPSGVLGVDSSVVEQFVEQSQVELNTIERTSIESVFESSSSTIDGNSRQTSVTDFSDFDRESKTSPLVVRPIDTAPILDIDPKAISTNGRSVRISTSNLENPENSTSGLTNVSELGTQANSGSSNGLRDAIFADNNVDATVWRIEQFRNQEFGEYLGMRPDLLPQPIALSTMQEMLRTLQNEPPSRQAAIIYVVSRTEQLELVLLPPEGQPRRYSVPEANRTALFAAVRDFRRHLTHPRRRWTDSYQASAQQLHDWIVAPLEADLEDLGIDTLLFSMDEGLRSLPVAALYDGQQFLVEKYSLSLIPSFALTNTDYQPLSNARVLAMGASQFKNLSPLPAVPIELEAISSKLWQGESFLNESFTENNLLSQRQADGFEILHLATHAEFQSGSAENSYIQLWDDRLQLDELPGLNFQDPPVNLLVLSACQTALGDREAELGFGGLALQSGAQTVLASLWSVSDKGTLGLMSAFYSSLDEASIKAEALQQAQIAMLRGEVRSERGQLVFPGGTIVLPPQLDVLEDLDLTHPYFWSGFTAIGSPW